LEKEGNALCWANGIVAVRWDTGMCAFDWSNRSCFFFLSFLRSIHSKIMAGGGSLENKNLTLRFRLFAIGWFLGAIAYALSVALHQKDVGPVPVIIAFVYLLLTLFTIKKNKISYYLASGLLGLSVAVMGISVAMLGDLLLYEPFIWILIIEILFTLLLVLFTTSSEIKLTLRLKPKLLKRKESFKVIVAVFLGLFLSWAAIWVMGTQIEKKYNIVNPHVDIITLNSENPGKTGDFISRHFVMDSIPIPRNSLLKMIWQGRNLTEPSRKFSLFVISEDDYIIWLKRGINTSLLVSGKTMAQLCGKVGPYQSMYDWTVWIATDRTAFLSHLFRGLSSMFSSGGMTGIKLLKTPNYLGIVEEGKTPKHAVISVDMIGKDFGNIVNLRVFSQKRSPEQLWKLLKPILTGMKPDITVDKIKHTLGLLKQLKSGQSGERNNRFDQILQDMDKWNMKDNKEWMTEARTAFRESRFEDCKWALVQPILKNYKGGKPYVLFGRTLMKQGYPDPAVFFFEKAEFWMKDNPELKKLEAEAKHELDQQDSAEQFKSNSESGKIIRNVRKMLDKDKKK